MIRILLGHRGTLLRGALAAVLSKEEDLHVVAEFGRTRDVLSALNRVHPDVVVVEARMPAEMGIEEVSRQQSRMLILVDRGDAVGANLALARLAPRVGLIATDASPDELVVAVRQLAHGRPVLDLELAMTALHAKQNPLTERECEVLRMLTTGATAQEIAHKLCLSAGTVRNYLSHILTKTGARSRIEAIRKAEEAGWI
ncbi:response regulator transcription factor [Kribbella catacumbae]|uniref:response regulator transcription factor n=1 Tax=Kribbella catacumbae TaxID=460086 RepID=UPI00047555A0|nr:response regulator transcription factor [Kribbella catacumbae]